MIWFNVSTKILRHNPIKKKKNFATKIYNLKKKEKKRKKNGVSINDKTDSKGRGEGKGFWI